MDGKSTGKSSAYNVLLHSGQSGAIILNTGSGVPVSSTPRHGHLAGVVVATPVLNPTTSSTNPIPQQAGVRRTVVQQPANIRKVLIKVCPRGNKKENKTFSLRNINPSSVTSVDELRDVIKSQLRNEVTHSYIFDVGYLQGSNVVSIRNSEDISEIWANIIKKGASITLWCDGMKKPSNNKRPRPGDDSSEDEMWPAAKKRNKDEEKYEKIESMIKKLKVKHGDDTYLPMQYRIWAEMILGGMGKMDNIPTSTMFIKAGGGVKKRSSMHAKESTGSSSSPAKVIEGRTKCYKQLSDLNNLLQSDLLSQEEFEDERAIIMGMLHKLV